MRQGENLKHPITYRKLFAPAALLLFAIAWYEFSEVYIQGANLQLLKEGNLFVYVPVQQLQAYMDALRQFTYVTISFALILLSYYAIRLVLLRMAPRTRRV